ncbi:MULTISPECIES: radical SAM family heme chaperone HemW [unclassified Nitratiruptor]|uniref:radical SAM family heme chaperone HemW n=1 Tax=unclassified Nitratiruptor TaxID=2624044 RepID=UPI001916320E|nr:MULTISPECIES: radical SAM family heme chaperone HemW [unclassified Nitratiruptor]
MLLYLHIPFCDSKCNYCAFNSFTTNHHLKSEYMQTALRQLEHDLNTFNVKKLQSVYIGGGTPSTIKPQLYEPLFEKILSLIEIDAEITVEANPNSATLSWLKGMKSLGATRISFGAQSFDDKKLKLLGRAHSPQEAIAAVERAFKVGFEHISIDLIYETTLDSKTLLEHEITQALKLPIDHISAYALILEPNTPFENKTDVKAKDENQGYFIKELIPFEQYEVSNYGKYRSKHNLGYWQLKEYIGIGCGAVGFVQNRRYYPKTDLASYIKNPLTYNIEHLSKEDIRFEKIFLGLRSIVGVHLTLVDKEKVAILENEGKVEVKNSKMYNKNFFLSDEIALFLHDF